MDIDGRLTLVLRDCAWAVEPNIALRLVPELAQDCPPIAEIPLGDGGTTLGIAWGGDSELVPAAAELVERLLGRALQGQARDDFASPKRSELLKDPLVGPFCRILAQTDVAAFQVQALPMLALARAVSKALRTPRDLVGQARPDTVEQLVGQVEQLARLPAARRAEVYTEIAWGIGGRTTAAFLEVHGGRGRASGLARRIASDPLALCLGKGTLDREPDLVLVAMVAALPVSPASLQHVRDAAAVAFQALQDRRGKGKSIVIDEILAHAVRDLRSFPSAPDRLLFHPTAGPLLVGALPELVDARTLEKEGVPRDLAKMLTRVDGVQGLAASWGDLVDALLAWDVIATVANKIVPLTWTGGHLRGPHGTIPSHPRWSMVVPRSAAAPSEAAVVALRLTEVIEHLWKGDSLVPAAHVVERAWIVAAERATGSLSCMQSEHGIAVFGDPVDALRFASGFLAGLAIAGLDRGDGERVQLPDHVQASAGVAWGPVTGGTDGRTTMLGGSAVARAVALAGSASPASEETRDPLRMSRVVAGPKGLESRGTVCDGWVVTKALEAVRARQVAIHTQGSRINVAGVAHDFTRVPVSAWWQEDDWVYCFYPLDPRDPGGASEHIQLSKAQFRRFFNEDQNGSPGDDGRVAAETSTPEGASVTASLPPSGRRRIERTRVADDAAFGVRASHRLPQVTFGLDVPEAALGDAGYAADLWGPEDEGFDPRVALRVEVTEVDGESLADAISYDGPVVSIEELDDPRNQELGAVPEPLKAELEDAPSLPDAFIIPGGLLEAAEWGPVVSRAAPRDAGFGGSTMTVRPPDRKDARQSDAWDDMATDPNIQLYAFDAEPDESEPTDERRPVATSRPVEPATRTPPPRRLDDPAIPDPPKSVRQAPQDLGPMLVGYVCLHQADGFTFGRIYGNRLVDVHAYPTGDQGDAYGKFLKDKIAEGFVPRMELTSFLSEDAEVHAVDLHLLNQTYRAMVSA